MAWQPTDRTTLFVSWSKSFNPNTSLDRNNKLLEPERGIQYEIGLRQELLDPGKLTLSLSVFDLTRRNIADCDPTFPDCSRSVAIGEQRIKGAEAELSGKPVDWLDLLATYAYLDGRVTESDFAISGIPVGSKLPEAAPHSASLFAKAALTPLGLDALSVSTGIYYVSARPGRDYFSNFFAGPYADPLRELPGSTRVGEPANAAAPADAEQQSHADDITVTATRSPIKVVNAPVTVTVIDARQIEDTLTDDIKDLVRFEPGVSVRSQPSRFTAALGATGRDGNAGFNIRGLDGNRVLIQTDGIRLPDAFAFGAQATGRGDYADLDLLKSVEMLRGPASALYGSDGLAGAVSVTMCAVITLRGCASNRSGQRMPLATPVVPRWGKIGAIAMSTIPDRATAALITSAAALATSRT